MHKKGEKQMRVFRTILGMLLLTIGLPALLVGAGLWTTMQHRDAGGAFSGALQRVSTPGYAVVVDDVEALLRNDAPFVRFGDTRLRLTGTTASGQAFIGIAQAADVARYLDGVSHAQVRAIDLGTGALPVLTDRVAGFRPPANTPADETFWLNSGSGALDWNPADLRDKDYSLVVMNSTAQPGVRLQATAEVRPGWLNQATWGLVILGSLGIIAGMMVLAWPGRRREVVYVVEPSQVPELADRIGVPLPFGRADSGRHTGRRPRTLADAASAANQAGRSDMIASGGTAEPNMPADAPSNEPAKPTAPARPDLAWPPSRSGTGSDVALRGSADLKTAGPPPHASPGSAAAPSVVPASVGSPTATVISAAPPKADGSTATAGTVASAATAGTVASAATAGTVASAATAGTVAAAPAARRAPEGAHAGVTAGSAASSGVPAATARVCATQATDGQSAPSGQPATGTTAATRSGVAPVARAEPMIAGRPTVDRPTRRRAAEQQAGERQVFEASAVEAWVAETAAARARDTQAQAAAILAAETEPATAQPKGKTRSGTPKHQAPTAAQASADAPTSRTASAASAPGPTSPAEVPPGRSVPGDRRRPPRDGVPTDPRAAAAGVPAGGLLGGGVLGRGIQPGLGQAGLAQPGRPAVTDTEGARTTASAATPAAGPADPEVQPQRAVDYQAEAKELLEAGSAGAVPARRRRKAGTGPAETAAGESEAKATRSNRKSAPPSAERSGT